MLLDKFSLLSSQWPVFLVLFLIVFAIFTLVKDFCTWCFKPNEKEKAKAELREMIAKGTNDTARFNWLAGRAGLNFGCQLSYFKSTQEIQRLDLKTGDIVVIGFAGMTGDQISAFKKALCPMIKGCSVFPVYDRVGIIAIITPDKEIIDARQKAKDAANELFGKNMSESDVICDVLKKASERAKTEGDLLRKPLRDSPIAPSLST